MDSRYLEQWFDLDGRIAVITGGGGVLCSSLARALGRVGARVAILDIVPAAAEAVAEAVRAEGGQAMGLTCDVLDKVSIESAAHAVTDEYGQVDILINGAGGNNKNATSTPDLPFFDLPSDAVKWVFDLNFIGTLLPCQVFGKLMADRGRGVILNISSMNAFRPLTRIPAYSAAKAAVSNFTQWLAVHMNQEYSADIRVNALAPGFFLTAQNRFLLTEEATGELTPRGRTIIAQTPMGRFGDPEELVSTMLWLLSDGASFITGIVVPVDGGFSAFSGV
jgi:NAD(P)-dependent dehydrogenase (short-subunit alcohol dehydrogenase family)